MAPKKQNNRTKLKIKDLLEYLNDEPSITDYNRKSHAMYDPYDRGNESYRYRTLVRGSQFKDRKPDSTYTEIFKENADPANLHNVESNMPMYDGVSKKDRNRKKLAAALAPFIGRLLPF